MAKYGDLCASFGERRPTIRKLDTVEEVLKEADVCPCWRHHVCVLMPADQTTLTPWM